MERDNKSSVNISFMCCVLNRSGYSWVTSSQAFLFSMVNRHGLGQTKLPLKTGKEQYGICCKSTWGPVFGEGKDLFISGNANTNTNSYSYSNLGDSHQCPPGQQGTFFTGDMYFTVTDYEVFGLHK